VAHFFQPFYLSPFFVACCVVRQDFSGMVTLWVVVVAPFEEHLRNPLGRALTKTVRDFDSQKNENVMVNVGLQSSVGVRGTR
jgi:hypothetical protein